MSISVRDGLIEIKDTAMVPAQYQRLSDRRMAHAALRKPLNNHEE